MVTVENEDIGLLSLFKGEIKGFVVNPYTGAVMSRRDVLDLYRYLAVRHIEDPKEKWSCEMLLQSKNLLGIPDDIHEDLMNDLRRTGTEEVPRSYKGPILEEVETLRFFRKGFCPGGAERQNLEDVDIGPGMTFIGDILELERGSLLFEMEEDSVELGGDSLLSSGYMIGSDTGAMDGMLSPERKRSQKR